MKVYLVMYDQYSAYGEYLGDNIVKCFAELEDAERWVKGHDYANKLKETTSISTIEVEERNETND